jgi:hypothetical protein
MTDINATVAHPIAPLPLTKPNVKFDTACHAEMQLLYFLEHFLPSNEYPDLYLGCSKKACWLCQKVLNNYQSKFQRAYAMRGSHGQVYPGWNSGKMPCDDGSPLSDCLLKVKEIMESALESAGEYQLKRYESMTGTIRTRLLTSQQVCDAIPVLASLQEWAREVRPRFSVYRW